VIAQRCSFVLPSEDSAPLQLGHQQGHEIIQSRRHGWELYGEAIGGFRFQPFLHGVGDFGNAANELQSTVATGNLCELPHSEVFAFGQCDRCIAAALACVGLGDVGQRAIEIELRGVGAKAYGQIGTPLS